MAYKFFLNDPIVNEIDNLIWFSNSYGTVPDWEYRDVSEVDKDYESMFNLKLIYGEVDKNNIKPIIAIEFQNQEEAVMFMLRWA